MPYILFTMRIFAMSSFFDVELEMNKKYEGVSKLTLK